MIFARRRFLALAAVAGMGAPFARGLLERVAGAAQLTPARVAARLVGLLRDRPPVRLLGKAYLWANRRPGRDELVERILPRKADRALIDDKRELRRAVRGRIEEDFGATRVVSVGGWLLSETEARLCGLALLESDDPELDGEAAV